MGNTKQINPGGNGAGNLEEVEENKPKKLRKSERRRKSEFVGSVITPDKRWEFINAHKENFIRNYKPKKGEEELTERELDILAEQSARKLVNRANKELKAYIKGNSFFKYKGVHAPVMTEEYLKNTNSLKEIIKHKIDEEE